MEKNFILFVVISAALLFAWNAAFPPPAPPPPKAKPAVQDDAARESQAAIAAQPVPARAGAMTPAGEKPSVEKTVRVDNGAVAAVLSDRGAALVSWKLLKYEQNKGQAAAVELIPDRGANAEEGEGYGALHFSETDFATRTWKLETPRPVMEGEAQKVAFSTPLKGPNFELRFVKEFLFYPGRYDALVRVRVENPNKLAMTLQPMELTWGPGIGTTVLSRDLDYGDQFLSGALAQTQKEKVFEKPDDANQVNVYENPKWVAQRNQYFVAALLPGKGWEKGTIHNIHRVPPGAPGREEMMAVGLKSGEITVEGGKAVTLDARLLGSHQEYGFLKSFGDNLQGVVQFTPWRPFRVLDPLAIAMLHVLKWFHALVHNWGVALILLTLLVKGAMFYPTMKGMVSMRRMSAKMARMQPRLETIKKMYKDDQNRLNQEMMKLYKEEGVNPLGGCLPMLVQMPIFFALYGTLLGSFELRGADFLWIWTDLSGPEKYPVMALIMGVSMYAQQKMTPQPSAQMNPDQARMQKMMMNIMPVMLTAFAIFGGWPSGLLLYWAASNVFSIAQQYVVNKKYPVEAPAAPAPAA